MRSVARIFGFRRRVRLVPLLFTLAALGLMFGLGTWQLFRLAWKENLIAQITNANDAAPLTQLPATDEARLAAQYRRITFQCRYLNAHEFHVAARYWRDKLGYHIFTPCQIEDGPYIIVNRGWVPVKQKEAKDRPGSQTDEPVTVTGILRNDAGRNPFTPPDQPEKNVWFGRSAQAMAEASGLRLEPYTVDLLMRENAKDNTLPIPAGGAVHFRNDHLQYAITWYLVGIGCLIIFIAYHRKPEEPNA